MYDVFDSFLASYNSDSAHDRDDESFYKILSRVVAEPRFNAEEMGDYFRAKKGEAFAALIDRRVMQAWTVREYLSANPQYL